MAFPFDLTEDATADLEEVTAFIAADNPPAALRLADDLEEAFRLLADWPGAGHLREDLTQDSHLRFWPVGRYLIVYLPERKPLLVIGVLHGARDIQSILPARLDRL